MRVLSLSTAIAIAIAMSLTACGDHAPKKDSNVITANSPAEADELQQEFAAQCADPAKCNPSVALLIARLNSTQIAVCTSFMVAPDVVATNKHCLPDSIQAAGAVCTNLIGFKFPGSPQAAAATAECATVLAISPYPVSTGEGGAKSQPDYAFLKLTQSPNRAVLRFDGSGIADQEHVTVVSMSPDSDKRVGTIGNYDCRAVQGTASTDSYTSNFSPIVQFNDCPVIHGNSGSPAIGSSGGVKAIIMQGAVDLDVMKAAGVTDPKPFGRATNFACVNEPSVGLASNPNPDCQIDLSDVAAGQRTAKYTENLISSSTAQADLIAAIGAFEKQAAKQFHWTPKMQALTDADHGGRVIEKFLMEPLCLLPTSTWLPAFRTPGSQKYPDSANFDGALLQIKLVINYDNDYRGHAKFMTSSIPVNFRFSPKNVSTSNSDYFTVTSKRDQVVQGTPQLAVCTPAQLKQ